MKRFSIILLAVMSVFVSEAQMLSIGARTPELKNLAWIGGRFPDGTKLVLIDFFMSDNETCMRLLPKFEALYTKYKGSIDFVLITKQSENEITRALGSKEYFIASDYTDAAFSRFGVEYLPYTVLIKPKRILLWQGNLANLKEATLQNLDN